MSLAPAVLNCSAQGVIKEITFANCNFTSNLSLRVIPLSVLTDCLCFRRCANGQLR